MGMREEGAANAEVSCEDAAKVIEIEEGAACLLWSEAAWKEVACRFEFAAKWKELHV